MKKNKILPNFCSKNISVKADGFLEVRRCDGHVVQTSEAPDAGRNFCRRRNRSRGRKVLSRHFHRWRFHFGKPTKNGTKHDSGERHSWRWVHQKLNLLIFKEIAKCQNGLPNAEGLFKVVWLLTYLSMYFTKYKCYCADNFFVFVFSLKNQDSQTSKDVPTTNHRYPIHPASLPCSIFFNCQKNPEKLWFLDFLFLKRPNKCPTMSLTEATERLEGAFLDADAKINNLTAKIDSTFKANDDENARGPAELMETLVQVRFKLFNNWDST